MESMELRLTDDELTAIALDRDSFWAGPLPTLDIEDSEVLLAAALRGQRSLLVRGLIDESGQLSEGLLALVDPLVGSTSSISTYVGDDDFLRAGWEFGSTNYSHGSRWTTEVVTPFGVHNYLLLERGEFHDFLRELLEGAIRAPSDSGESHSGEETDPGAGQPATWMCVAAADPSGAAVIGAQVATARTGRMNAEGQLLESEASSATEGDAAGLVDSILQHHSALEG